jgi:MarR family transcriptional regulator, organic hydroperoxide resistance regulator
MPIQSSTMSEITDHLQRLFMIAGERAKRAERETGLTGQQLWAFRLVADSGPVKISELVRRMRLHPTTIGGMLDRLEAKGVLSRNRCRRDRRVVRVELTMQGKELARKTTELDRRELLSALDKLSGERLADISSSLGEIVNILAIGVYPDK